MDFNKVITETQEVLNQDLSWKNRYINIVKNASNNIDSIEKRRKSFHKWGNLSVYYTIGYASHDENYFDLRYLGQSVGEISFKEDNLYLKITKDHYTKNKKSFKGYPKECQEGYYKWQNNKTSQKFKTFFDDYPEKKGHPEAKIENLALKEFINGKDKSIRIQPVTIAKDIFFQMQTPVSASGKIKLATGSKQCGIDILARTKDRRLTVIELKPKYQDPNKVIKQAIAYATFIAELCNTEAKSDFWNICKKKDRFDKINVACMLPDQDDNSEPVFKNQNLEIPNSSIKLNLHYIYYKIIEEKDEDNNKKIERIEITRSSLK